MNAPNKTKRINRGNHRISRLAVAAAILGVSLFVCAPAALAQQAEESDRPEVMHEALIWSAQAGYMTGVRYILDSGADIDYQDAAGVTPLLAAVRSRQTPIVEHLLARGADLDRADNNGWTPIMIAAAAGYPEIVNLLASKNADLNRQNSGGVSAILVAVYNGYTSIVSSLIHFGADLELAEYEGGFTPLWIAYLHNRYEIARMLLANGANPNPWNRFGFTPLMDAAYQGNVPIIKLLLAMGANPLLYNPEQKTARMVALESNQQEAAALLEAAEIHFLEQYLIFEDPGTLAHLHLYSKPPFPETVRA